MFNIIGKLIISLYLLFYGFIFLGRLASPKHKNAFVFGATICLYGLLALYCGFGFFVIFGKLSYKDLTIKIKKAIDKPL